MTIDQLKEKALSLPYQPGVYLMKDAGERVIYVGKAKRLKSRVSQYFQDAAGHSPKTRLMVSKVDHFDVIIADSEFEALVLECSLIKQYQPKYNILLKDDKGYPYIRLDMKQRYPVLSLENYPKDDGAHYFGPFGSRGTTNELLEAIKDALKLPRCSRSFPRDIGKQRPCLHFHMKQCLGYCRDLSMEAAYKHSMEQVKLLLQGEYKKLAEDIRTQMQTAADALDFETAAVLRDRLSAIEHLGQKQHVATDSFANLDVVGYEQTDSHACFTVLHFSEGNLLDKDHEIFSVPDDPAAAVSALLKQYYITRGAMPKMILLPFAVEDSDLLEQYAQHHYGRKTVFKVPQRGDNRRLVALANKNALEEAQRVASKEEKNRAVIEKLRNMLELESVHRIESFDISNISGTDIVASMVVCVDGKFQKSAYKRFKIEDLTCQDDYASMQQVLLRRFIRMQNGDAGFMEKPNLLLIDGGITHASIAVGVMDVLGLDIPVFGMVKDERHRTRALVTADGREIRIDHHPSIFSLIGRIQEETHRFAITYHKKLRSNRLRKSVLDEISGIGPKRKADLLKVFGSVRAIKNASCQELAKVLPGDVAVKVYEYFNGGGNPDASDRG